MLKSLSWCFLALLIAIFAGSWSSGGIVADLLQTTMTASERVERLQAFFHSVGALAPFLYVGFVVVEVVIAPIPGLMLYAPGGMIFGPWYGGLLALAGNVIGAGIACQLVRSLGTRWCNCLVGDETVEKLQQALERRGLWLIILLRVNPLTSTDLVSYAAGLTRIPVLHVMLATGISMAPLCLAQSWLSDSIFKQWPQLLWPMMIAGAVYLVAVVAIVAKLLRRPVAAVVET
jgi:uncharacterized membrane protein YdjX (TVP38/TMEM64 family)